MREDEFVSMMNRLFGLACAECATCSMGLEPECVNGFYRHRGHDLCLAAKTHARMAVLEADYNGAIPAQETKRS